jgi:hypothetical protein
MKREAFSIVSLSIVERFWLDIFILLIPDAADAVLPLAAAPRIDEGD